MALDSSRTQVADAAAEEGVKEGQTGESFGGQRERRPVANATENVPKNVYQGLVVAQAAEKETALYGDNGHNSVVPVK